MVVAPALVPSTMTVLRSIPRRWMSAVVMSTPPKSPWSASAEGGHVVGLVVVARAPRGSNRPDAPRHGGLDGPVVARRGRRTCRRAGRVRRPRGSPSPMGPSSSSIPAPSCTRPGSSRQQPMPIDAIPPAGVPTSIWPMSVTPDAGARRASRRAGANDANGNLPTQHRRRRGRRRRTSSDPSLTRQRDVQGGGAMDVSTAAGGEDRRDRGHGPGGRAPGVRAGARQRGVSARPASTTPQARRRLEDAGVRCVVVDLLDGWRRAPSPPMPTTCSTSLSPRPTTGTSTCRPTAVGVAWLMEHHRNARAFLHCSSTAVYKPMGHHVFAEDRPPR